MAFIEIEREIGSGWFIERDNGASGFRERETLSIRGLERERERLGVRGLDRETCIEKSGVRILNRLIDIGLWV